MSQVIKIVVSQFLFVLFLFTLVRFLFLGVYWELFQEIQFSEILLSLLTGLRFDLAVICKLFGLLNLALFLPIAFLRKNRLFHCFIALIGNVVLIGLLFIQVIDLGY